MKKETTNGYEELCSYENLLFAFQRARKGKILKDYVINFEKNLEENLKKLRIELLMQTYKPASLKTFILRDPKTRKISKSDFRDRIIHHAICNIIEPNFDKKFISDSFANRLRKGSINAIKRFDYFKRKISRNNTRKCFILKADIKKYFDNVDHNILINILKRSIEDERIIWLIKTILKNYKTKEIGKGMPLGNLTSQFFANIYLNELDQFVKHKLKAKYYIRYVDDFVILNNSPKILKFYKEKINNFLETKLDLELHPDKTKILKLEKGINFLGFRIFYHHKLLSKKNIKKFERNIKKLQKEYSQNEINREKIIEKIDGWIIYAKNANTHKYCKKLTSNINILFPEKQNITIDSVKKHENFNKKIYTNKIEFTQQKTLQLLNKGLNIRQIAEKRNLKENTIWEHIANLVEHHQIPIKRIISTKKVTKIMKVIKTPNDKLKDIKNRLNNEAISYNEINIVLANIKGKHKKKNITYFVEWYQKTNCYRKCYHNKNQIKECRIKFQQLIANCLNTEFTKNEFLEFINNQVKICQLPEKDKRKFVSWQEFQKI
jgi:retron-type reverse transcriptase